MQTDIIYPNNPSPDNQARPVAEAPYAMINSERPLMNPNTNTSNLNVEAPLPTVRPPKDKLPKKLLKLLKTHRAQAITVTLAFLLLVNLAVTAWLFTKTNKPAVVAIGAASSSSSDTLKGDNTLYLNTATKSVGVAAPSPEGLQVGSDVTQTPRKTSNVRLGLLGGEPTVLFEDKDAQQFQVGINGAALQFAQPGAVYAQIDKNGLTATTNFQVSGNTTLGGGAGNTVTVQAATLSTPNNLNIGNKALFVDSVHGSVAIGGTNANGYRLYVAGSLRVTSSVQADGQIIAPAGSASTPSLTFAGNTDSGIFSPGANITSVSAGGGEVLRVQPGNVAVLNGASLSVNGFLQAGGDSNSPAWKLDRLTGTLDGSGVGAAGHGISNAPSRVIMAMAWYQGAGGQAKFLSVDVIDGSNMHVSGGLPGVAWRGVIMYTSDTAGW